MSLKALVTLQHLTRSSDAYLVLSGERSGVLHFESGELIHAETDDVIGNLAALEILSWTAGEFIMSTRSGPSVADVSLSLRQLLGVAADATSREPIGREHLQDTTEPDKATGIRRRDPSPENATYPAEESARGAAERPTRRLGPTPAQAHKQALAAVATPGTAMAAPGYAAKPAARGEVHVSVNPRGELVESRGPGVESVAARAAYVVRLSELIGEAMGAGEVRSILGRGRQGEFSVRRRADGHIAATCCAL